MQFGFFLGSKLGGDFFWEQSVEEIGAVFISREVGSLMLGMSCTSPLFSYARFCKYFAPGELPGTSGRDRLSLTVPSELITSVEMSELKMEPGLD